MIDFYLFWFIYQLIWDLMAFGGFSELLEDAQGWKMIPEEDVKPAVQECKRCLTPLCSLQLKAFWQGKYWCLECWNIHVCFCPSHAAICSVCSVAPSFLYCSVTKRSYCFNCHFSHCVNQMVLIYLI